MLNARRIDSTIGHFLIEKGLNNAAEPNGSATNLEL